MPAIPETIKQIGLALMNQSNHSQVMLVNTTDSFNVTSIKTNTPTFLFSPTTTQLSTTTTTVNTTTSPADSEESTSWIYISLGVLCWVAIFVGCGFAWTQLCKAFYFSSNTCGACARTCRNNPGMSWIASTKFFRFYFGNDGWCCQEHEDDSDDEPRGSTTQTNAGISDDRTTSGNDSIPSTITNAPPPPYEVAIFMRRPGENSENADESATVTFSSLTDAVQTLEEESQSN